MVGQDRCMAAHTMRRRACLLLIAAVLGTTFACPNSFASDGDDLAKLEMRFFEHSYPKETTDERLKRLEGMVFGEAKTGSDSERVKNLVAATQAEGPDGSPAPAASGGGSESASSSPSSAPSYNSSSETASQSPSPPAAGSKRAKADLAN